MFLYLVEFFGEWVSSVAQHCVGKGDPHKKVELVFRAMLAAKAG